MNKYKIYCTEAQTIKAHGIGAPIDETAVMPPTMFIGEKIYSIPTAEQMIGWLEEQGILIDIHFYCVSWDIGVRTKTGNILYQKMAIDTRKEATLAAINVALEYLSNNNLIK